MQVVVEIKASTHKFAIQLDESTDVCNCTQLICFACYIVDDQLKAEYLFCLPLETTTTAQDIIDMVSTSLQSMEYSGKSWELFARMGHR